MEKRTNLQPKSMGLLDVRDVRPALAWTTLARAERLAHPGAG